MLSYAYGDHFYYFSKDAKENSYLLGEVLGPGVVIQRV